MTIRISFTRELTLAAIDGIAKYYEVAKSRLQMARDEDLARMDQMVKDMGLNEEDALSEWDFARQQHEITFDMLIPNYFRYSFVVLLCLVLESKLGEICEAAHNIKSGSTPPPKPQGNIVREYKEYLAQTVGACSQRWADIHDLTKIRNCIVHASGKVKGYRDEKAIRALGKRGVGVIVSGGSGEEVREGVRPLYLEDDTLMLQPKYCMAITKTVRALFEELCDALPLCKFSIDPEHD